MSVTNSALRTHHSALSLDELKSALWGAAVLLRGKINATGYKEYIFPLVFFKRISDVHKEEFGMRSAEGGVEYAECCDYSFNIPKGCSWDDIREVTENVGQALVTAWTRIEQANPDRVVGDRVVEGLGGIFGKRDHWTNKNLLPDQTLSELIEHFSKLDLSIASCPADEMGNAYEYLVGKFADDAGNTAQEFYTNRTVVELMAEILEPKAGESIYDPTCGTGGMLISCIARCKEKCGVWSAECGVGSGEPTTPPSALRTPNWREIKAYGQEQNALTSSVARMNLFLHGVEEFRIVNDDTLLRPGFLNAGQLKTFNVVLANPPYSIKQWNRELFANDPYGRNFLGTPPQGRADYAFIQHIFKSMDPKTGRCAILLPHGVLFREEEKSIRKALIEADILEAVIGLAPNLFYNSPMEACIMICRSQKSVAAKGRVLFVNAVNEVTRKNAESKLEPAHIEKLLKVYRERPSDGVFSYDATVEEIAGKDYSLAIPLYAHMANVPHGEVEGQSFDDALAFFALSADEAKQKINELTASMNGEPVVEVSSRPSRPETHVPILEARNHVKFNDIAVNSVAKKKPIPEDATHYIGLEHIDSGSFEITRWGSEVAPIGDKLLMKKGDVLFGRRRAYQRKVAIAPFDGIFSAHGMVLRPKTDVVDPGYFPFFIASDQFMNEAVRISVGGLSPTINWKTLKECEFDLPPIEKQQELAELLWAANDLKESYKKMIVATDEMLKAKFREMFGECGVRNAECGVREDSHADTQSRRVWPMARFEDVAPSRLGKMLDARKQTGKWLRPYLANVNVQWFRFDFTDLREMDFDPDDQKEFSLQEGDLLVCEGGEVGRCAIWHGELRECYFQKAIHRVRCDREKLIPDYVAYWFLRQSQTGAFSAMGKGTTIAHLPGEKLKELRIPLPPLALQQQFVEIARKADETKASLKKSIADVEQVIKGLING